MSEPQSDRSDTGLIHSLLDQLASDFAASPYDQEIAAAREEYFTLSGKVFEDDTEVFEARSLSFLEWYVIERRLQDGPPPVIRALEQFGEAAPRTSRALARIATSHRSLFDIAEVEGNRVELEDVLGGARFSVVERRSTVGFEVGALLEARIIWEGEEAIFGKTFLCHPKDARLEVLDLVDSALLGNVSRDDIMFRLARLYLRWHRHGHVNAGRIYKGLGSGNTAGPIAL